MFTAGKSTNTMAFSLLTKGIRFDKKTNAAATATTTTTTKTKRRTNDEEDEEDDERARRRLGVKVAGRGPFPALDAQFDAMVEAFVGQDERVRRRAGVVAVNIEGSRFKDPTPVQMQAIPVLREGRDLLAMAPTGSGKTATYLLPAILGTGADPVRSRAGVRTLVIVPTHELADQIAREAGWIAANTGFHALVLGPRTRASVEAAFAPLSAQPTSTPTPTPTPKKGRVGIDLLVTTPLALVTLVKEKPEAATALADVELLVLDEADRLFEMGFVEQVDQIIAACEPRTKEQIRTQRRAMLSATMPPRIEELAESVLRDPIRVRVGADNAAADTIDQKLVFCGDEEGKLVAIKRLVREGALPPPCLVFVQTIPRAKQLALELAYEGLAADALHGDRPAAERDRLVADFRQGKLWFLVATEVLARGVDFRGTNSVLNYDLPATAVAYIHRVGRCGRAGRRGSAVTFFVEADFPRLRPIANVVKHSGCDVPEWMLSLKRVSSSKKHRAPVIRERVGGGGAPPVGSSQRRKGGSRGSQRKRARRAEDVSDGGGGDDDDADDVEDAEEDE